MRATGYGLGGERTGVVGLRKVLLFGSLQNLVKVSLKQLTWVSAALQE